VPVAIDHVALEEVDGQDQCGVRGDGVDASLEVGQLDDVVLQLNVRVGREVGEALDADDVDDQVEGGQVLQGVPDLCEEVLGRVL
jgi:hypothetical protein